MILRVLRFVVVELAVAGWVSSVAASAGDVEHGRYVFTIAGCSSCHTTKADKKNSVFLAGGRAFKTAFGTFFSPNITPDPKFGIGEWSEEDLARALKQGVSPKGDHYFPVFPYPSYTRITDEDIRDLWAYLRTVPAVRRANREHDAAPVFGWRISLGPWKAMNFKPGPLPATPAKGPVWNRGAYIVEALAHCGECHTPRDRLGGRIDDMHMAGTANGPDGVAVPNITAHKATGIGGWSDGDFKSLFSLGMLPDGDFVGDGMGDVVDNLGILSAADRQAIIVYLKSLPAIENRVSTKSKGAPPAKSEWQ